MTDGNWSDYVADAGTDPAALSETSASMGDLIEATQAGVEAIDPSLLPDAAADDVSAPAPIWTRRQAGRRGATATWPLSRAGRTMPPTTWQPPTNGPPGATPMPPRRS